MKPHSDTRERFLGAIAQRVPREAIAEAHMFQPIKQGGLESGVAVVAVNEPRPVESQEPGTDNREPQPASREPQAERRERLAVYTAQYKLTLKGPDRGKWEFSMHAEADAPLVTVDAVVRGVQRRSGDAEDPAKLSGDEVRALLPPLPVTPPDAVLPPPSEAAYDGVTRNV